MEHNDVQLLWGYPKGVFLVATTELWERFSYWGLIAIFSLFLTAPVSTGGFGWSREAALRLYGLYAGAAFAAPLIGGWIANNFWGERRCIVLGGWLIVAGHLCLAGAAAVQRPGSSTPLVFFAGLFLIIAGTGLLKPTISSIISHFFPVEDRRRDGAFGWFFVAVYVGCILGTFVVGYLGERVGWHWGFSAAALGMLVSLALFLCKQSAYLGNIGIAPSGKAARPGADGELTQPERDRIKLILLQGGLTAVYAAAFFQSGGFLLLFAEEHLERRVLEWTIPASWLINVAMITFVVVAPLAIALWSRLARRGVHPSAPLKLAWALLLIGSAYLLLACLSTNTSFETHARLSWLWMVLVYICFGCADVLVWPNQIALTSRLAPRRLAAVFIGGWYVTIGIGTWLTGYIGALGYSWGIRPLFFTLAGSLIALGCCAWKLTPRLLRLSHGLES